MITVRNVYRALRAQLPLTRIVRNFLVTGNGWGLFSERSHQNKDGRFKVRYSEKNARRAAQDMTRKKKQHFSVYKCVFCDDWHIGRNRDAIGT